MKKNATILIVDDEPQLLMLNKTILESKGYRVTTAGNGAEAQQLLGQQEFQLLLSDIIMPEMDGYSLAAWIQENQPHIPIQLVSGFTEHENQDVVDESLKENILNKPFTAKQLLETVRRRLDEP